MCQVQRWRELPAGQMVRASVVAQSVCDDARPPLPPPPALARSMPRRAGGVGAFAVEALGGTLGSAAGLGLGILITDPGRCSDDLTCTLESLGVALGISGAGSGIGSFLSGRLADTDPSTIGGLIGGLLAIPAGVGVAHLLSEEMELTREDFLLAASYSLTQGIITALGSRIGAALRN
jgi:hypothetical protein